ncbi:dihydropyrimidinase [Vibrio sp. E150_011]
MMEFDLVLANATVVTASDQYIANIGIRDGKIAYLGTDNIQANRVIDAKFRYVLPGGVDAHCHMDQPCDDGAVMADDFDTGTLSALCGGTTTVIPFALQQGDESLFDTVSRYRGFAENKARIDYAVHVIMTSPNKKILSEEVPELTKMGYSHFKIYMTYDNLKLDDRQILDVLSAAKENNNLIMVHAENDGCISWLTERLLQEEKKGPEYHAIAHSRIGEREATFRAIALSELVNVPILIVHVSNQQSLSEIQRARRRGVNIFAETCPQYLFLTQDDLGGEDGIKYICSPPPRSKYDQDAIWQGLKDGSFQVFSSDHCPFDIEGDKGKKVVNHGSCFHNVPNGIPGIETRLPLLMSHGVDTGKLSIHRFVQLTATAPARLYGLYPQKGTIAIGSDADLVIWSDSVQETISNSQLHHNVDYTPYEGMSLTRKPRIVISRGAVVFDDGKPTAEKGQGQFVFSGKPDTSEFV